MAFTLSSPAFRAGEHIPAKYTCDGDNRSPPFEWKDPPEGTNSFGLIAEDPDALRGPFVHWLIYNLPSDRVSLEEGVPKEASLPDGSHQGMNSAGKLAYTGPCPPSGAHRYVFRLYALDRDVNLPPGESRKEFLNAVKGHVLEQAELMGIYSRP